MTTTQRIISTFAILGTVVVSSAMAGENISTASDTINSSSAPTASHTIRPPSSGKTYVVKVNFLKVETAASIANGWIDKTAGNAAEKDKMRSLFSAAVDHARKNNAITETKSAATFSVVDPSGNVIKTEPAALFTLGHKIEFSATTTGNYSVKLNCTSGAGIYHMVFEKK